MRYLIKNGSIIDPAQRVAMLGDVLIENGKVVQLFDIAESALEREALGQAPDVEIIHARGCIVSPGFTDLHTHLREPGQEQKETIATGTMAAVRGGFTCVCAMPNTEPPLDNAATVRQVRQIAWQEGHVQVEVVGAITQGRQGRNLSEMAELVEAGCVAFSDDGSSVADPAILRNAMAYASMLKVPIMCHCEDTQLNKGWAMHEGAISTRLGLPGYPAAAEEAHIARDLTLAELTGVHLHICHVSTAGGVALIRNARQRGVHVTAEVAPHHLTLTDRWVLGSLANYNELSAAEIAHQASSGQAKRRKKKVDRDSVRIPFWLNPKLLPPYDTRTRVNPPLRTEEDIEALIEGLCDGTIDAIATDHAPHTLVDKECEYGFAACGISGLETALGLVLMLAHCNALDLMNVVAKLTEGPAAVLGRNPSSLRPGSRADIVIFDPDRPWIVETAHFASKGKNNPLQGQQLKGQVMLTMSGGSIVYRHDEFGKVANPVQPSKLNDILPKD